MKKFAPIAAIALFAVAFTSCKKDYTCECKGGTGVPDMNYEYNKQKKADAEAACKTQSNAYTIVGGNCTLK